uniref:Aspartate aminotransferase n=1 Tax=Brugia malayi TaxID=6279 RepID=Q95VP1_BRUMA|nr:aspartate aminotransferase [Brugia malayi]
MASFFGNIEIASPIEVFYMNKMYHEEPAEYKVNLTVGAYRTEEGQPWVLPVVREAEKRLADDISHEYLPVLGYEPFCSAAVELVLGKNSSTIRAGKAIGVQCLSGTGSLKAGADFLSFVMKMETVYVSKPTWGNHKLIFARAGFTDIREYYYWDSTNRCINMKNMLADLETAPENAVVVLHGCAHNPTGMDPTRDQWKQIAEVFKRRHLFPFFDLAYQGFASGDLDADAWAVRYFVEQGLEMFCAQSFAKNFGLYNERVGNLTVVASDPLVLASIKSQMSLVIRSNWSNPPSHGARIVHMILTSPSMCAQWHDAIKTMSSRIKDMRYALRNNLEKLGTPGTWEHITQQIGMFSFIGLNTEQVDHLIKKYKVFLLKNGRINVCGLNPENVEYVAKAINETINNIK